MSMIIATNGLVHIYKTCLCLNWPTMTRLAWVFHCNSSIVQVPPLGCKLWGAPILCQMPPGLLLCIFQALDHLITSSILPFNKHMELKTREHKHNFLQPIVWKPQLDLHGFFTTTLALLKCPLLAVNFEVPQYCINATQSFFVQFSSLGPPNHKLNILPLSKHMELKIMEHIHNFLQLIVWIPTPFTIKGGLEVMILHCICPKRFKDVTSHFKKI
jgi:hypothetical protein